MLDALKKRLAEIETAHTALPEAAIAIANKLRGAVNRSRSAMRKRNAAAKRSGAPVAAKRHGSGIPIVVDATGDSVIVRASEMVQAKGRENGEPDDWMQIFSRKIVAAAKGGS